jgi:2',3'-cyclic-nucleotide 2'-phosphodiesterase/3'-nucleotidase
VDETRLDMIPTFADEVRPDAETAAFIARANAEIEPITSRVLGEATVQFGRSRARDSALGNWITDAMRTATGVDIALQNPGGIRTELDAGPITVGDIYQIMPFDNRIATVELTGAQVREVLENGVSPSTCIQVSGIKLAFDPARPRGKRILEARTSDGALLDAARTYKVAANDFMAQGGDGFTTFAQGKDLTVTGLLVREVMEKDVAARSARGEKLAPAKERRIDNRGTGAVVGAADDH